MRLVAEDDDTQLFPEFGMLVSQQSARFYQVVDAFPFVRNLHRAEQHELLSCGSRQRLRASCRLRGLKRLVLMGLGMHVTACPQKRALVRARSSSQRLQVTKLM